MSEIGVRLRDLGKAYQIGGRTGPYKTIRESLTEAVHWPTLVKRISSGRVRPKTFWALRNVSFDVVAGEVVGIIGQNGAGKSTLLKVLSRITEPTEGEVQIRGRVRSLLEVGTGFHPELTGRENIFMNGAILGMRRKEIIGRFDEIVSFSGIDQFIDTAVKHYSSGMYLRLAFAVAAHLEPEILIIDEVLAVGDAAFQKKCLGKMNEVAKSGRTVFFVSHNLPAVQALCTRAVLLESGSVSADCSDVTEAVGIYVGLQGGLPTMWIPTNSKNLPRADSAFQFLRVAVRDSNGQVRSNYAWDEQIFIDLDYRLEAARSRLRIGFQLQSQDGVIVLRSGDMDWIGRYLEHREPGFFRSTCCIPPRLLNAGRYLISLRVDIPMIRWVLREDAVIGFEIGVSEVCGDRYPEALLRPELEWVQRELTREEATEQGMPC